MSDSPARPTARRNRLRLAVLLGSLLAGPLLVEGLMRFLLFHPSERARDWGADLRDAGLFADPALEDEYWLLDWQLSELETKAKMPPFDERLGWVKHSIQPGTYLLAGETQLGDRRPVLLYGASYAQGFGSPPDRFEGQMEQSSLGAEYGLLNYGVGGYGIGQVYLLMKASLDHFQDRDPVVVIGAVADSDFDRCVLSFRAWPKAHLVLENGTLVPEGPVPAGGPAKYVEERGIGIKSYAWRYLLHSPTQIPAGWQDALWGRARKERVRLDLERAIVLAIRDELERRGLDYFFLLFSSPRSMPPHPESAAEAWLVRLFEESGIPYVRGREHLLAAESEVGTGFEPYFIQQGVGLNHPTPLGNRVLFGAIRDGIEGRFSGSGMVEAGDR